MKKIVVLLILTWATYPNLFALSSLKYINSKLTKPHLVSHYNINSALPISSNLSSIDSLSRLRVELLNHYPLSIGNKWVYLEKTVLNPNIWYEVITKEVIGDSLAVNGKLYFHLVEDDYHYLDRIDSVDGKIYRYYQHPNLPESEYLIANLSSEVGDTIISFDPTNPGSYSYIILSQIDTVNKWGLSSIKKTFQQITFEPPHLTSNAYTEGIGIETFLTVWPLYGSSIEQILKGCLIDGIVYGDTTLTDIDVEENLVITNFKLAQNYPNPFNPSTKISWQTPVGGWQTLKVYDVLGNEIATLVDEFRNAGAYEIEFNPALSIKNPASGIYFYCLQAGDYAETKKMIYLK
ncbi:MAG: T9SS type A sorting domain-containing protein [Ignavibacteriaceae bacterium]